MNFFPHFSPLFLLYFLSFPMSLSLHVLVFKVQTPTSYTKPVLALYSRWLLKSMLTCLMKKDYILKQRPHWFWPGLLDEFSMSLEKTVERMSVFDSTIHWAKDAQPYYMFDGTFLQLGEMKISSKICLVLLLW